MQNQSHNHNVLDTNRIGSLLMKLTAPMFFGLLVQNIYQTVDTIFIGRFVGAQGLAAFSIIMPIQMLTMGAGNMISMGGASLISRLIGRGDTPRAERALGNSISFAILFSLVLTVGIVGFIGFWLKVIGTSESLMPFARTYLVITTSGMIFSTTGNVLLGMARAEGNARVSMISMLIQSVLNIILDAVFMIGLGMGISGAAIAMVISQAAGLIYVLTYYLTGSSYLKLRWRNFIPDMTVVRDIFAIGMSQFLQTVAMGVAALTLVRMISQYGGDIALSAFGIGQRILVFSAMPAMVLGQAMQPILGFNYGAKRFHNAIKTINLALISAAGFGVVVLIVLLAIPGPIIRVFTPEPELIEVGIVSARLLFLSLPLFSIFSVGQMVFPSVGKVWPTLIVSTVRPLLFLAPLAFLLPRFLGINGVWLSFPGSDALGFLLVLSLLIPLIKKFRKEAAEKEFSTEHAKPDS